MGHDWPAFRQTLQESLLQRGLLENEESDLLLFLYPHPHIALVAILQAVEQAKNNFPREAPLPIQIVLHLNRDDDDLLMVRDPADPGWDSLTPETLHVTRALKLQWETLMARKELPAHSFAPTELASFYELQLTDSSGFKTERLFPHRELPARGSGKECFYCGSRGHRPAACPSKLLTMETRGLQEAGYQSLPDLANNYRDAFAERQAILELIKTGIAPAQIRENPKLQAFLTFFDISAVYQLRFLRHLSFAPCTGWNELRQGNEIEIDSRNLDLGLDCLRVGQYDAAAEYLEEGRMRREGKLFHARIGLAFRSLELDRLKDMATLLESALSLANLEKEKVYINLLLIRYHALQGDLWKAEQTSNQIATLYGDQLEVGYARAQMLVRQGFVDKANQQLQKIIYHRHYFLAALIDPSLLPIQGLVENLLTMQLDQLLQKTGEAMGEAETTCEELKGWFESDDPELRRNQEMIERLRKQHHRGSYFDLLDVLRGSKSLATNCQRLLNEKIDWLQGEVDKLTVKRHNTYRFWQEYPFKAFFRKLLEDLLLIHRRLDECRYLIGKRDSTSFRKAVILYQEAGRLLEGTKPRITRMLLVKEFLKSFLVFGKKLLFTELAMAALALAALFGLPLLLSGSNQENSLAKIIGDTRLLKQATVIGLVFVAPVLAMALTLRNGRK